MLPNGHKWVLFLGKPVVQAVPVATLAKKIAAEERAIAMLADYGLPEPDAVEYGDTCIRLFWHEQKVCVVVQIDEPPEGWQFAEELEDETHLTEEDMAPPSR